MQNLLKSGDNANNAINLNNDAPISKNTRRLQILKNYLDESFYSELVKLPPQRDAFGFDWGTTRSGIATMAKGKERPEMVENKWSGSLSKLTPSIVALNKGIWLVGEAALNLRMRISPEEYFTMLKRLRGRTYVHCEFFFRITCVVLTVPYYLRIITPANNFL
jgi:hypothetical protein